MIVLDGLEWGDPPRVAGRPQLRQPFVNTLQANPGNWAKYPQPLNKGSYDQMRREFKGIEWTTRMRTDRKLDVYGRAPLKGVSL